MKRPVGLILSSIALGFAAICLLLMTALMAFAGIASTHRPSPAPIPHFAVYACLAVSVVFAILAVWAILTIIGILRLRSWARYSILVIGGGVAAIGIFGALGILLSRTMLSTLPARQPAVDPHIMTMVFLVMAAIYLLIAAVGIWWLIYFNLRSTRELFQNQSQQFPSANHPAGRFSRTPTAIKILGGFFLFSAFTCVLCAFLPFPAFLLGFIIPPAGAHILYLGFAVIAALAGYGLLQLKEPARLLTIGLQIVGCCNVFMAALPWYQAQLQLYTTRLMASIPAMPGQPHPGFTYSRGFILFSCFFGLLIYGFILWLLHRHRAAFRPAAPPPPIETMLEA